MNEWRVEDKYLVKEFECENYVDAVKFIKQISELAEIADHHPDILLHSYKKVKVMLRTHDKDKITQKDYTLAEEIDNL